MRQAFVQEAILVVQPDIDLRAPGGAITAELCGDWEHEGPCPLAPHHTRADRVGEQVHVRVLFAAEPDQESTVRQRIGLALAGGRGQGPDGTVARWELSTSQPGEVTADETDHAQRLTNTR